MKNFYTSKPNSNPFYTMLLLSLWLIAFFVASSFNGIMAQALSGVYTINAAQPTAGTNFQSFNDFATSLNTNGISSTVTAVVVPGSGPYTEQVIFTAVTGASANARVIIEGNGESITALTSSANRHVIRLSNVQFFEINHLKVLWNPASASGFMGIHIFQSCNYITIRNCTADMTGTTASTYGGFVASGSATSILSAGVFDNVTFLNNTVMGGGYGISVYGQAANQASHITVDGNTVLSCQTSGIYLRETLAGLIANNRLDKLTTNAATCNMIYLATNNNNTLVYNNIIQVSTQLNGTSTMRGIYVYSGSSNKVFNNVIQNVMLENGNFTAIEVRLSAIPTELTFNTISIDNPVTATGNRYGIVEGQANSNAILRNNIISITQPTSGMKAGLVINTSSVISTCLNSNYNDFFISLGGNVVQKGTSSPTVYQALVDWQVASGQDANSFAANPMFYSPTVSVPTNSFFDNRGTPVSYVLTDFTGMPRGSVPDPGAFELTTLAPQAPDSIFGVTELCINDLHLLQYTVSPVAGAISYDWTVTLPATILSGQGSPSVWVDPGGSSFTVSASAWNTAGSSPSVQLSFNVHPLPVVSLEIDPDSICLSSSPLLLQGGTPANGTYSGPAVSNGFFDPFTAGAGFHLITYTYTDTNACIASATDSIFVDVCTSMENNEIVNVIHVFPNPASAFIQCIAPFPGAGIVRITDLKGRLVWQSAVSLKDFRVPCSAWPAGTYILQLFGEGRWLASTRFLLLPE